MPPRGPRSPAQLGAAQQTTSDLTNNPSSPAKTKTSVMTQVTDGMAYSTPSRYAGVLHALEVLCSVPGLVPGSPVRGIGVRTRVMVCAGRSVARGARDPGCPRLQSSKLEKVIQYLR